MPGLHDLTIVVPTRNEAANIGGLLGSIPPQAAVIVVDRSTDATRDRVRDARPQGTTVIECDRSLTEARQVGAYCARSRWLLFTDADVRFTPGYFDRLASWFDGQRGRAEVALLFGPKLSLGAYRGHYQRFAVAQGFVSTLGIPAASGSNMLVRADAFAAVGGFDLELSCNEDSELGWRIARAGWAWRFDPQLIVEATDHRRLHRGCWRKTLHTVARCSALYLNLVPRRWRRHDWGYWKAHRAELDAARDSPPGGALAFSPAGAASRRERNRPRP